MCIHVVQLSPFPRRALLHFVDPVTVCLVRKMCIMILWRVSPADRERFSIGLVHRVTEECKRRSRGSYE